jgi:hypothetical protein
MKELKEYKDIIKERQLKHLLCELEYQVKESEFHRLFTKNDELEEICKNKILIVKELILEKYKK